MNEDELRALTLLVTTIYCHSDELSCVDCPSANDEGECDCWNYSRTTVDMAAKYLKEKYLCKTEI